MAVEIPAKSCVDENKDTGKTKRKRQLNNACAVERLTVEYLVR